MLAADSGLIRSAAVFGSLGVLLHGLGCFSHAAVLGVVHELAALVRGQVVRAVAVNVHGIVVRVLARFAFLFGRAFVLFFSG